MAAPTFQQAASLNLLTQQLATLLSGQNADGSPAGVVGKVSAGFMAAGQTAKQYVGKVATSATLAVTAPLETVTAGKTLFLTDMLFATDSPSGAATTLDVRVQAAGVDIFRCGVHNIAPISMPGIETQPFATSGQAVTVLLPATPAGVVNVWFNLFGFEQ